jgi:hypothetical protein
VYTQDEYVEDRDLSSANSLPWQILTEESPKADGSRGEAPPQVGDADPATEANGQGASAPEPEPEPEPEPTVPRIGDFTSAFDKTLERDLDFEVPVSVRGPPNPVQLAPLPMTTQFGHSIGHGISAIGAEVDHPVIHQSHPAEDPVDSPGRRRLIPTLPRFG